MTRHEHLATVATLGAAFGTRGQPKSGYPAYDLPPHITRLIWFGERADWRHDGKRCAFLNRAYGDVYEYVSLRAASPPAPTTSGTTGSSARCT